MTCMYDIAWQELDNTHPDNQIQFHDSFKDASATVFFSQIQNLSKSGIQCRNQHHEAEEDACARASAWSFHLWTWLWPMACRTAGCSEGTTSDPASFLRALLWLWQHGGGCTTWLAVTVWEEAFWAIPRFIWELANFHQVVVLPLWLPRLKPEGHEDVAVGGFLIGSLIHHHGHGKAHVPLQHPFDELSAGLCPRQLVLGAELSWRHIKFVMNEIYHEMVWDEYAWGYGTEHDRSSNILPHDLGMQVVVCGLVLPHEGHMRRVLGRHHLRHSHDHWDRLMEHDPNLRQLLLSCGTIHHHIFVVHGFPPEEVVFECPAAALHHQVQVMSCYGLFPMAWPQSIPLALGWHLIPI